MSNPTVANDERWWALVGPALLLEPSGYLTTPHDSFRALDSVYNLGELRLEPGDRVLVDYVHMVAKGWSKPVSWPIIVSGAVKADWPSVARKAARDLHRLCCLLSLAWAEPWQVRLAPQLTSYFPPEVPEPVLVPNADWLVDLDSSEEHPRDPQPLPEWVTTVWTRFHQRLMPSVVDSALSLWHEGILLQAEHPSMAMVAYVAAVENVAEPVLDSAGHRSSRKTFWDAISKVASGDDFDALKRADPYGKRSATSHGGALHGIELEFGHMLLQPIGPGDPTYDFMFDVLRRMAGVSRAAILGALS